MSIVQNIGLSPVHGSALPPPSCLCAVRSEISICVNEFSRNFQYSKKMGVQTWWVHLKSGCLSRLFVNDLCFPPPISEDLSGEVSPFQVDSPYTKRKRHQKYFWQLPRDFVATFTAGVFSLCNPEPVDGAVSAVCPGLTSCSHIHNMPCSQPAALWPPLTSRPIMSLVSVNTLLLMKERMEVLMNN